jgi:hypothetical protein
MPGETVIARILPLDWLELESRGAVRDKALGACSERRRLAFRQNAVDDTSTRYAKKSSGGAKRKSGRPR